MRPTMDALQEEEGEEGEMLAVLKMQLRLLHCSPAAAALSPTLPRSLLAQIPSQQLLLSFSFPPGLPPVPGLSSPRL